MAKQGHFANDGLFPGAHSEHSRFRMLWPLPLLAEHLYFKMAVAGLYQALGE